MPPRWAPGPSPTTCGRASRRPRRPPGHPQVPAGSGAARDPRPGAGRGPHGAVGRTQPAMAVHRGLRARDPGASGADGRRAAAPPGAADGTRRGPAAPGPPARRHPRGPVGTGGGLRPTCAGRRGARSRDLPGHRPVVVCMRHREPVARSSGRRPGGWLGHRAAQAAGLWATCFDQRAREALETAPTEVASLVEDSPPLRRRASIRRCRTSPLRRRHHAGRRDTGRRLGSHPPSTDRGNITT